MKKVLLYSGGMDSWLMAHVWKPDIVMYVNMHTKYSENELKNLESYNWVEQFESKGMEVKLIDFPLGQWERDDAIIPLRNLYLVMCACNVTGDEDVQVLLGATAGDRVLDKSFEFASKASDLLSYLYSPQHWIPQGKKVEVCLDYKKSTKADLLHDYKAMGGNLDEAFKQSFSCYNPINGKECWHCKPCFRKFVAFDSVGYKFPDDVAKKCCQYIQDEILPQIKRGTYGRGKREEDDIVNAYERHKHLLA